MLIENGTTVITPNRRLSASLLKRYQQSQTESAWTTPDILPASTWIQRLYQAHAATTLTPVPLLLNSHQENLLWEDIIKSSKDSERLLRLTETAEMAKSAWTILNQWLVTIDHPLFNGNEDTNALVTWIKAYQTRCRDNDWIDSAMLPTYLHQHYPAKNKLQTVILYGFNEISPQLEQLLSHFNITTLSPNQQANCKRLALADEEEELNALARWAQSLHQKEATLTIGCVIPGLENKRDRVIQVFSDIMNGTEAFNVSAGKPLLQCPIIHAAIQLLHLSKKHLSLTTLSGLLSSPFIGQAESERIKRAKLDAELRKDNITTLALPSDKMTKHCPQLSKRINEFFTLLDVQPKKQTYHQWAKVFTQLLAALGWPGERSLNSDEYQMVEHWLLVLNELASLDHVAEPPSLNTTLQALQKIAAKSIFQPKTPATHIQILGPLEAAGLAFDHLWMTGMDDMNWPPQPKPNPFIPKRLQRELNMPHATMEREFIYCQQLIQQFKSSTQELIFSHAKQRDELELNASPLIREIVEIPPEHLNLANYRSPAEIIYASKLPESLIDNMGPSLTGTDKIHGGVSVIKQQALCPFKAFAEWRLFARELESPLPGLRQKDRGTLLHKVMEMTWNQLKDHTTLCEMDEMALQNVIEDSIASAFSHFALTPKNKPQYLVLEKKRLHKLVLDWLTLEKERSPFQVLSSEKSAEITLNQLTLSIKIDRIDFLPDQSKLIIDYKTSKHIHVNQWQGDRPEEPQLPLYALLDPNNTAGISFAQLTPGKNGFKGISRDTLAIEGITATPTWNEQLKQWQTVLTQLSDDFYRGMATVDPKDGNATCTHCHLAPLCRINEEGNDHDHLVS